MSIPCKKKIRQKIRLKSIKSGQKTSILIDFSPMINDELFNQFSAISIDYNRFFHQLLID